MPPGSSPELRNFNIDIIEETHARRGELASRR
jgi:hypothetical protein